MQENKHYKNLFLSQSYKDNYKCYINALTNDMVPVWDYVIITASNYSQAKAFRLQIDYRIKENWLCTRTKFIVLSDPENKRVGSGGAALNALKYLRNNYGINCFDNKKILMIHSGGDSSRIPQYSVCGKLFSKMPHLLPNGRCATLFDETIVSLSGVPSRFNEGLVTFSGDVVVFFNPLQIDYFFHGTAVFSSKESLTLGKNHGVFLADKNNTVRRFLHKQSPENLISSGAADENNQVCIDTGISICSKDTLQKMLSLISTDNKIDDEKFLFFVNDKVRLNFYSDFLYPMASDPTLEDYLAQEAENSFSNDLAVCKESIWHQFHDTKMKLFLLDPCEFIHFGTTREMAEIYTKNIDNYRFLDWSRKTNTNALSGNYTVTTSYISPSADIQDDCYIENAYIGEHVSIGKHCVISNIVLENVTVPEDTCMHALKMKDGRYTVRIYPIDDNPKALLPDRFAENYDLSVSDMWDDNEKHTLWNARLFPICDTLSEAVEKSLSLLSVRKLSKENTSMYRSYIDSDANDILIWEDKLSNIVRYELLLDCFRKKIFVGDILEKFGSQSYSKSYINFLIDKAESEELYIKIRIYNFLSFVCDGKKDFYKTKALRAIQKEIRNYYIASLPVKNNVKIVKDTVKVTSPLRVNWGGGWSDTPPYCLENGGTVLNAAVNVGGIEPVEIIIKKLTEKKIIFVCQDDNVRVEINSFREIYDCENPSDMFLLHKAALLASGIISYDETLSFDHFLEKIGGGFSVSTNVIGIPRGSGLGTSSILSAACIKALAEFFGETISENDVFQRVLCLEQIMFTGGGWQDQVGGAVRGIKLIKSTKGICQDISYRQLAISPETLAELQKRFCIIFSGQRRLARNLLRDVVNSYLSSAPNSVNVLEEIQDIAHKMSSALECGDIDEFAHLFDYHWEQVKIMYPEHTNECIEEIFALCADMIDGKMVCGAGGGGFLQVILKKEYTQKDLEERLFSVFGNEKVAVYDCTFAM